MAGDKVLVAMSGGVDSSVCALLLQQAGYECVGATMRLYDGIRIDCKAPTCCSLEDVEDARNVAAGLGMEFHVLDYREAFERQVMRPFVDEYARGRTPNPCIMCNRHLKFDLLFREAEALGCRFVATGHYARVERGHCQSDAQGEKAPFRLRCGVDARKDQSYVLYTLAQPQLSRLLLPLGGMDKGQVRAIAEQHGLPVSSKNESQDICFVPDGDYAAFLEREGVKGAPGPIFDQDGREVGRHRGIEHYTIGQRKGLGISMGQPVYVTRIDAQANAVTVGPREALELPGFWADDVVWTDGKVPEHPLQAQVRTHYHARLVDVEVRAQGTGAYVRAASPLGAVAPGQAAVFYQGEYVVGGGTIV